MYSMNLDDIKLENVYEVYSGKEGCAGGSEVKYYTDIRNIRRIYNIIKSSNTPLYFSNGSVAIVVRKRMYSISYN